MPFRGMACTELKAVAVGTGAARAVGRFGVVLGCKGLGAYTGDGLFEVSDSQ